MSRHRRSRKRRSAGLGSLGAAPLLAGIPLGVKLAAVALALVYFSKRRASPQTGPVVEQAGGGTALRPSGRGGAEEVDAPPPPSSDSGLLPAIASTAQQASAAATAAASGGGYQLPSAPLVSGRGSPLVSIQPAVYTAPASAPAVIVPTRTVTAAATSPYTTAGSAAQQVIKSTLRGGALGAMPGVGRRGIRLVDASLFPPDG